MLTKETKPIFLLLFSLFIVNIGTTQINIDGYNDVQQPLVLINTSSPSSESSSFTTAAALGGERDIEMTINTGPTNSVSITSIVGDQISVAFPLNTTGEVFLTWDGVDGMPERSNIDFTGLGGVDLTATGGSNNRIVINDVASDDDFTFVLTVYSDGVNFSTVTQAVTGGNPDENFLFPLNSFTVAGGVGADFTNVGAITLEIQVDASSQANDIDLGTIFVESAGPPPAPEMIVYQDDGDDTEIPNGDMMPSTLKGNDFNSVNVSGGVATRLLTIENTGNADLLLTGNPIIEITGPGADQFTVDQQPSTTIQGGGMTTFRILFDPADDACGQSDATVSIANNDSDENPYTFAITANGIDNLDPTIDCSAIDVTRDNDAGECSYTMPGTGFDPTFSDNCSGASISNDFNNMASLAGAEFPVGSTSVVWMVTDAANRTATCQIDIVISDTEAPSFTCPPSMDINTTDGADCEVDIPDFSDLVMDEFDNCDLGDNVLEQSIPAGLMSTAGAGTTITVDLSLQDNASTPSSGPTTVWDESVDGDLASGGGFSSNNQFTPIEIYEGVNIITGSLANITDINGGTNADALSFTVPTGASVTAISATPTFLNGNTSSNFASFSGTPLTYITATFTSNNQTPLSLLGIFGGSPLSSGEYGLLISENIVEGVEYEFSITCTGCPPPPAAGGNVSDPCSVMLTVVDDDAPMITCPGTIDPVVYNNINDCQTTLPDYTAFVNASDNCTAEMDLVLTQSPEAGEMVTGEQTVTITITVEDEAGLTDQCTYMVEFVDEGNPMITCPSSTVAQATVANCMPAVNGIAASATDNCTAMPTITYSTSGATTISGSGDVSGNTFAVGTTTVTYTATDDATAMNTATCSFTVTVEDNTTCGCDMPQPGDVCDDMNPATINDMIQDDCSCMGIIPCDIEITSVDVSDETCAGDNDGSITINATCTTCDGILYSIDGGMTTQSSPTFTGLSPDTYQPFVVDSGDNTCDDTDMDATVDMGDPLPAAPVAATATKAFCVNPDLVANLANTGINVSNSLSANEKVVWVMTSAPANSPYSVETQLTTDDCGDPFKNFGTFAVANTSKVLRVNDIANAVPGTYTFDAYIENCETGCVSELTSGFSITVNEMPSVMITADLPIGIGRDLCLGQEDVQYNAVVTSTDGGTYSYLWCAYNSGDGSGTCFNGFDDNTAQDPMRDWTSSAGAKSVGVTVMSDVAGCEAEDLYSFEVVAPTMLECPDDIMATLETDPMTYDCATDITFNNPSVEAGPCDPVNLTIEITGPSGAGPAMVTPGEEYVFSVEELGEYTVTYNLSDAVGNTSSCSFKITVDGLLCGWVDNGGIGDCAGENASDYDQDTETYMVSSNGCVPAFPYTGDNQAFINTQLCGDGYIEVFVDNITAKGFAGISLRESQAPGAKKVEIGTDNVARIIRAARVIDGYPAFPQELISFDKFWLKIERTGNTFRASASTDGVSYTPYLFQTIMMGECLEAGLWAYSTNPEDVVTATFNNVTVVEYGGVDLQAPVTNLAQSQTDLDAFDVSLTPNPAKGQVTLNLEQLIGQEVMIRLYNINGQLMQQQPIEAVGAATHRLDLSNLPQGAYWVQVQSASGQKTMKLIKQ